MLTYLSIKTRNRDTPTFVWMKQMKYIIILPEF